jgi:hypothetical protein
MFVGTIKNKYSLNGYVTNGLVETNQIKTRHEELAVEMQKRGMKHKSFLEYNDKLNLGKVDVTNSLKELYKRCNNCAKRIKGENKNGQTT